MYEKQPKRTEGTAFPGAGAKRGCPPTSCNNSLVPERPPPLALEQPLLPRCPSQRVWGSSLSFSMLPQGCCSENTDKMGTGAMKAKILSLYACSFFWVSLLVIKKKKKTFSHSVHLSNEEAHFKDIRQGVCFFACTPRVLSWSGLSTQRWAGARRGQVGVVLGTHLLLGFFPPGYLWDNCLC